MERVETRGGVPLETRERERGFSAAAAAACAGLIAGLTAFAGLRGCVPAVCGAAATRAALEENIRKGVYPSAVCEAEEPEDDPADARWVVVVGGGGERPTPGDQRKEE